MSEENEIYHNQEDITLRCNRCGTPITPETAVLTPTGYRCKDCVRSQQKVFDTTKSLDIPLAFIIAAALSFAGSWMASHIGFFTVLLAPAAGMVIAEAVRLAVQKRRSKLLFRVVLWGTILGSLPFLVFRFLPILTGFMAGRFNLFGLLLLLWQAIYTVMSASTVYYQLSGIRLR